MRTFFLFSLIIIVFISTSCTKDYLATPNKLNDTITGPLTALPGEEVKFQPLITGSSYYYRWDFGDGSYSDQRIGVHDYVNKGSYVPTLKIYNYERTDSAIAQSQIIIGTPYLTKIVIRNLPFTMQNSGIYWHGRYGKPSPYFVITKEDGLSYNSFNTSYKKEVRIDSLPLTYELGSPFPIGGQARYTISLYNKSLSTSAGTHDQYMYHQIKFKGIPSLNSPYVYQDNYYEIEYYFEFL